MARATTGRSPANLQKFLRGADYPATKDDLLELAENNGASSEVLDIIDQFPDVDFEGVTDVQECYSQIDGGEIARGRGEIARGDSRGESREFRGEGRRGRSSADEDDPDPSRVSSQRRVGDEELQEARRRYEARKKRRQEAQDVDDAEWDRRLKGHETDAISDARHMRHGYDGRGRVRDEESDRRLRGNETEAIKDAREMRHGYDGRGRVRKFGPGETDETISDDRERYEERQSRDQGEVEADPETGAHSRRRKDDQGRTVRGGRETWQQRYGRGD